MSDIVTLELTKEFLKVDGTYHDDIIQLLIAAAEKKAEDYCSTFFVQRETTEYHTGDGKTVLYLFRTPIVAIESVSVDGEEVDYTARMNSGVLIGNWPNGSNIEVVYTAGILDDYDGDLPDAKLGILTAVAIWFNNRLGVQSESISGIGSVSYDYESELPQAAKNKLAGLRKRVI